MEASERSAGVHLVRTEENVAAIEALAVSLGGRAGMPGVLDDLDRRAHPAWAPGRKVARALTWDAYDRRDRTWWPQGIACSYRTDVDRPVLLVSWYRKGADGKNAGSRITVLDLESRRYRHVLLVEPVLERGRPRVHPVRVHAGGLVWQAPYLHVAATGRGFLTCRLDDLMHVPDRSSLDVEDHRYVLPVRFAYRAAAEEGVERLRYSFLSLDRSGRSPAVLVGEYGRGGQTRRLARFPVAGSGLLEAHEDGVSRPVGVLEEGLAQSQGAVVVGDAMVVTVSHGPAPGDVYVGRPGSFRRHRFATPPGPEDLCWWPASDDPAGDGTLWSVTEHPGLRWVFAMERRSLIE